MSGLGYGERRALSARSLQRALPWIAGLVLLAGVVAALVKVVPNENPHYVATRTKNPTVVSTKPPKSVPLSPEARRVAGEFILTAVLRKHLERAWVVSGPGIRQGMTRKEFLTGNIPVVPFPFPLRMAPMKKDFSYRNHALLEVALLAPKSARIKPQYFYLELKKLHGKWLVDSFVPRVGPKIPVLPDNR